MSSPGIGHGFFNFRSKINTYEFHVQVEPFNCKIIYWILKFRTFEFFDQNSGRVQIPENSGRYNNPILGL